MTSPPPHDYLSTACLHGRHDYCACDVGIVGAKKPNTCKWCDAQCRCTCHDTGKAVTDDRDRPA